MRYKIWLINQKRYFGETITFDSLKDIKTQLVSYYENKELESLNLAQIVKAKHLEIRDTTKTKVEEPTLELIT